MSRSLLCSLVGILCACTSVPDQKQIDLLLKRTVEDAGLQFEEGLLPEASVLLHSVERIDPSYPGAAELRAKIGPDKEGYLEHGLLGMNRRDRVRVDRGWLLPLLLYPLDRALDVLDLFSFDVHAGVGALANVHATRAVQAGAGLRTKAGVGLHNPRSVGLQMESAAGVTALALGTGAMSGVTFGFPRGVTSGSGALAGFHRPSNPVYQDYRDYWAIGAQITAGLVGVDVDVHPVQLFDLLGGFFFLDFARDDVSRTRALKLSRAEHELMIQLSHIERAGVRKDQDEGEADEEVSDPNP